MDLQMQIMAVDFVLTLAKNFAGILFSKLGRQIRDKKAHDELYFQTAYSKYLYATKERNEKVKTLLYKQAPQNLYDFYECIGVSYKKQTIDTSDVNNVLKVGHKLIVTGTGGIGKTIMMKHFFLNCIEKTECIPVLVELRSLNDKNPEDIDINDAVYESLTTFNFELEREYYDFSLSLGKYVFIFDGYDEVKSNLAKKIADCILQLSNKYPENYYIVSSRPLYNNFVAWSDFCELKAQGLTKEQALSLIKKLNYDKDIKNKFYTALKNELYDKYNTFATNPLLLTIMLMTFAEGAEIPKDFNDFYEQAFIALYKAHDASKGAYVRDKAAKLGLNEFKLIFSYVCFKSFFKSQYSFNESQILELIESAKKKCKTVENFNAEDFLKDLTDTVCMLVREGLSLRFTHRSFQEYFAAHYTAQLDDVTQEKLIKSWLNDYAFLHSSEFLKILYRMQPERFEKNVLIPGLKELKKSGENKDEAQIINLFFNDISVNDSGRIGIVIEGGFCFAVYEMIINLFDFKSNRKDRQNKNGNLYSNLVEKGLYKPSGQKARRFIPVKDILCDEQLKQSFIEEFSFFLDVYEFGMAMLENKSKSVVSRKKKLIAILEDL